MTKYNRPKDPIWLDWLLVLVVWAIFRYVRLIEILKREDYG